MLARLVSETGLGFGSDGRTNPASVWNSSSTTIHIGNHNNSNVGANPNMHLSPLCVPLKPLPPSPPPYAERPPDIGGGSTSPPPDVFRGSSSLSWIGDELETAKGKKNHREPVTVVDLTFDSAPSPSPHSASPSVSVKAGTIPDIIDVGDDRDFEYAIQLQIQEIQRITAEYEDGQMARHLMMGVDDPSSSTTTATPRYNLRPKPHRTGIVSNAAAGPSSRPLTTSTTTKAALDLTPKRECMGCFDPLKSLAGLQSSCGHHYCLPCVRNLVTASVSDESLFPPKCCNQPLMATFIEGMASAPIPTPTQAAGNKGKKKNKDEDGGVMQIELLGLVLDDGALKEKMEERWREWSVKGEERVYCSHPSCAVFLGGATEFDVGGAEPGGEESHLGRAGSTSTSTSGSGRSLRRLFNTRKSSSSSVGPLPAIGRCRACSTSTCISCRQVAHAGQTCADSGDTLFWDTVNVKRWRKCPSCAAVIEKNGGCSHVVCRCGKSFTYQE
ncbi:hypothetical protein APHAL10511_006608 [Amanita phalloides]|nr:hypothetical protein APHAL10511_006608 [Amanita phalloides]